ncbi:MAG: hypothetical protein K8F91_25495 [Candidatus Obscuribacterales bacterium]|nr:hypothetical protein [Candidatus Obscuribacterales bacterium]
MARCGLHFIYSLVLLLSTLLILEPALAQDDDSDDNSGTTSKGEKYKLLKLEAVRCVTWWYHDANGYHPAVRLIVQNSSGVDLSGVLLKFQARFTNMQTGFVNIDKGELRTKCRQGQQLELFFSGPRAFELPIDPHLWPKIECKVMARIGEVGDEGTQTVLLRKIDPITMSVDDAKTNLQKQSDLRSLRAPRVRAPGVQRLRTQKALEASAGTLGQGSAKPKVSLTDFLASGVLPGLGDDFYQFEKKYGLPLETETGNYDWTWANYRLEDLDLGVIAGSKGANGKADLIVATIPAALVKGEQPLTNLTRALSGKFRSEQVSPANHSVRYLNSGRLEFGTFESKNYRAAFFTPTDDRNGAEASYTLVVTRIPGNVLSLLRTDCSKAKLLRFLAPIVGAGG